ncbi:MAG: single-stranded DNA-binding protein [Flavobacteriales bacterium]|nr:single-stranded DNA-binding protein [Flavobacteriales bacterium]
MEKMIRNRVQLMGNLGKDPSVHEFNGGKRMARFSVATNERFTYGDGQTKEDTQWLDMAVGAALPSRRRATPQRQPHYVGGPVSPWV